MVKKKIIRKKSDKKRIDFFEKVYEVVARIPYGKVATYGDIAEVCGIRSSARTVGWALNSAKDTGLPCHRVVNRFGALTGKFHFGSPDLMEELLKSEGVEFNSEGLVKMDLYKWKPRLNGGKKKKKF
jgi:O-6-methylguanine DNA methyltransferase